MPLFVLVLLKRRSYNKETKREGENERRENQNRDKRRLRPVLHQTRNVLTCPFCASFMSTGGYCWEDRF